MHVNSVLDVPEYEIDSKELEFTTGKGLSKVCVNHPSKSKSLITSKPTFSPLWDGWLLSLCHWIIDESNLLYPKFRHSEFLHRMPLMFELCCLYFLSFQFTSQGTFRKATWRGILVAVKKLDDDVLTDENKVLVGWFNWMFTFVPGLCWRSSLRSCSTAELYFAYSLDGYLCVAGKHSEMSLMFCNLYGIQMSCNFWVL
jgi:hypothetical protein